MRITTNLQENFPFISVIVHVSHEYVGIIINQDAQVTSMYDYSMIKSDEEKQRFLELGEVWWWESNRQIPIDVFLHYEMRNFRPYLRTFTYKDVEILFGPVTSLQNLLKKRIKRRSIQLIRKTS